MVLSESQPPLVSSSFAHSFILLSSNMATKELKEYTLEEISQVFIQLFDLPVMFGRNNGSIAKKATLWVGSTLQTVFVNTTNTILSVDYHRCQSL